MSVVTILPNCKHDIKTDTPTSSVNRSRASLKSMESLYTTSSVKFSALNRRKGNQRNRDRNPCLIPAVSEVKQRVISARMLRMKQLQNQIGEAQHRIAELTTENRVLKSLHKRQDSALSKYESTSAELPQLLHSHAEEVRVWQTRCRNLQRQNKELMAKIKQKDTVILSVTDQNKHLVQLNKDKNLEEREKLAERVKDLEQRLLEKDGDMKLLARRLQLEAKSYRSNLYMEQQKYRDLVSKIELSDFMIRATDTGDKKNHKTLRQAQPRVKSPQRSTQSKSATSLTNGNEKDHLSVPLVLPPCDEAKKPDESIKNNSPRINNNAKLLPDADEIDLTKNRIDKSEKLMKNGNHSDDEITVTIRNGMTRAKNPQLKSTKIPSKLTPLQPKSETKKSEDDSEFSDEDFHLFREHNGTKMAHNARDLLDHKMHLSELESKMKQNSLEAVKKSATSSSSTSSLSDPQLPAFDDIPIHSFHGRGDSELAHIQRDIRDSMIRRESFLDEYCETLVDGQSAFSNSRASSTTITPFKKLELAPQSPVITNHQTQAKDYTYNHGKSNGSVISNGKSFDPKKKSKLLAALKNIDNEGSFEG